MQRCAMYPILKLAGTLKTWQIRYCASNYKQCQRFIRTLQGHPVPPELMPNGTLLKRSSGQLRVVK
jgi:hypothetical protein